MTKRMIWVDSLKGILILIVVCSHSMQYVLKETSFNNHFFNIMISFMMPAFFAVSGYVNYRLGGVSSRIAIIKRRFRQLVIPFFLWAIVRVLINPPFTLMSFANIFLYPDGSFWFLWVLFIITTVFYWGDRLAQTIKVRQEFITAFISLAMIVIMIVFDIRSFGFQFIAYYFMFFSTGYYINKYPKIISKRNTLLFTAFIIWFVMAWFWDMHRLPSFLENIPLSKTIMQYVYRFITALFAIYLLFGISPQILNQEKGLIKPINKIGVLSLGIYTTHLCIMPYITEGLSSIIINKVTIIILDFALAVVLSWLIVNFLSRWTITSRYLLGKI